jgi:hypothetical protein
MEVWNGSIQEDNPNNTWSSDSWTHYASVNDELHGIVGYDQIRDTLVSMDKSNENH